MKNLTSKQAAFVAAARKYMTVGPSEPLTLSRETIITIAKNAGMSEPQWLTMKPTYRVARGAYTIPSLDGKASKPAKAATMPSKASPAPAPAPAAPTPAVAAKSPQAVMEASMAFMEGNSMIPEKLQTYVPFGCHTDIKKIVESGKWAPVYVTGLSGNGKTTTFEQVCAELGREFIRVNITPATDEDTLIGGFRFINNEMVWVDGPVILAMKRGAVLLLDEVDLGTTKIMCLQSVLEGKGKFIPQINQWVYPKPGFIVGLTGNTKGRGDETGRFIGANVMNEAFLDRVAMTFEQEYPKPEVEEKILTNHLKKNGSTDLAFANLLVRWADQNRRAFAEGAIEEVLTTRRLIHAVTIYSVFNDRMKAVDLVLTRFDPSTRQAMIDLYRKLDASSDGGENKEPLGEAPKAPTTTTAASSNAVPF